MNISIDELGSLGHTGDDYMMAYNRGKLYIQHNKYEEALMDFNKSIEINSDFLDAYEKRGYCYYRLQKHEEALKDFFKVYNNQNDNLKIINLIIDTQRLLGNFEYAINMAYAGIRVNATDYSIYYHRGLTFMDNNQLEFAIPDFFTANYLNPNESRAIYQIGVCFMYLEQKEIAIEYFSNFIEKYPNDQILSYAYYQRAIMKNQTGDFIGFKSDLLKSSELGLEQANSLISQMDF